MLSNTMAENSDEFLVNMLIKWKFFCLKTICNKKMKCK